MKIFFTASYQGKTKYQKDYNLVLRTLESTGAEIVSPEKGNYLVLVPDRVKSELKDPQRIHYEAIRRGILAADAVVIEISQEDFQLGHEATLALQAKKHVLCLSIHDDFSEKITNRYFHGAKYNSANIEEIIEDFVAKAKKELLSRRFNLFLTSSHEQFLKMKGEESGEGASEYLRRLIDKARLT